MLRLDERQRQQELGNFSDATTTSKKSQSKIRHFFENNKAVKAVKTGKLILITAVCCYQTLRTKVSALKLLPSINPKYKPTPKFM